MDTSLFQKVIEFLTPFMNDRKEREALVRRSLHGCSVLDQIDWDGNATTFTTHLVNTLVKFGSCNNDDLSIQTLLVHLGNSKGGDVNSKAMKLYAELNQTETITLTAIGHDNQPVSDDQKLSDKRLVRKLWRYINSQNIHSVYNGIQSRNLEFEFYKKTIETYLIERNLPENQFIIHDLEVAFEDFDKVLSEFVDQLATNSDLVKMGSREVFIPHYKLSEIKSDFYFRTDEIRQEKERQYQIDLQLAKKLVDQHRRLVRTIKCFLPDALDMED